MNREDIIRMARDAGADRNTDFSDWSFDDAQLERFAALVAAAEREACAKVCEDLDFSDWQDRGWDQGTYDCANAIRARGKNGA